MVGIAYFKKGRKAVVIAGKTKCCQIRNSLSAAKRIMDYFAFSRLSFRIIFKVIPPVLPFVLIICISVQYF